MLKSDHKLGAYFSLHRPSTVEIVNMDRIVPGKVDVSESKEIDALYSLSEILQTGLNKRTITIIADLIQSGIEPESLVDGKKDGSQQTQPACQLVISNSIFQIRKYVNSNGRHTVIKIFTEILFLHSWCIVLQSRIVFILQSDRKILRGHKVLTFGKFHLPNWSCNLKNSLSILPPLFVFRSHPGD